MALIFANITDVKIPEGNCIRIQETVGGRVLWEKTGKYEIRKNGSAIDRVTIEELQRKIGDGTAETQYGIGAQLVLTIEGDYSGGTHFKYEYPMNFAAFKSFTKQNNQTVSGLGLHAAYGLPVDSVFNYNSDGSSPTGRWRDAKVRTWMNSDLESMGGIDVTAINGGAVRCGMMYLFPDDFISAVIPVKVQSIWIDGTNYSTFDKFFLLSLTEMSTDIDNSGLAAIEGPAWEYWAQRLGNRRVPFSEEHDGRKIKKVSNNTTIIDAYWTRTPENYNGNDGYGYKVKTNVLGHYLLGVESACIVPACVLPGI